MPSFASVPPGRALRCALLVLVALGTGCCLSPYSTPESALSAARRSARGQHLESLQSVLAGEALRTHSSPEALNALGDILNRIESIASVRRVAGSEDSEFETTAVARSAAGDPVAYRLRIRCETVRYEIDTPFVKGHCWPANPDLGLPEICDPDTQSTREEVDIPDCRLTEIKLAAR